MRIRRREMRDSRRGDVNFLSLGHLPGRGKLWDLNIDPRESVPLKLIAPLKWEWKEFEIF